MKNIIIELAIHLKYVKKNTNMSRDKKFFVRVSTIVTLKLRLV